MQDNFARAQPLGQARARRYGILYTRLGLEIKSELGLRSGLWLRLGISVGLARESPCLAQLS